MTSLELRPLSADEARREHSGEASIFWVDGAPGDEDLVVLGIAADGVPTWLMLVEGRCVGMIGTHEPLEVGSTLEIGYHVAPSVRGCGMAKAAVRLLLNELLRAGGAGVVAEVDRRSPHREASLAVLRANGFAPLDADIVQRLFVEPVDGADLLHRPLP